MKKIIILLLITILALSGCGSQEYAEDSNESSTEIEQTEGDGSEATDDQINVDKGLLNVEITLPASMFEGQDLEQIIAEAKADGVSDITKNDDGSLTYKMSKSTYNEIMENMKSEFDVYIDEMKNGEDFTSIKDIKYNDSLTEMTLIVDQEKYENSFDGFASMGLGIYGIYYQIFDGSIPDDAKVTINVQNVDSGNVFDTIVFPDSVKE